MLFFKIEHRAVVILESYADSVEAIIVLPEKPSIQRPDKHYRNGYEVDQIYTASWYSEGSVGYTIESIQRSAGGIYSLSEWSLRIDTPSGYYQSGSDYYTDEGYYATYATAESSAGTSYCEAGATVAGVVVGGATAMVGMGLTYESAMQ